MARNFQALIQGCDSDIRSGKPQDVARRLRPVGVSGVPREFRLPLANICRRAGLYSLGLKLLRHVVRAKSPASAGERASYAMLLLRTGAIKEAIDRLQQIDGSEVPELLLYRAWAHFLCWEYQAAIPLLESYLKTDLKPYASLVAKTNLAYAYGDSRKNELALRLHDENIKTAKVEGNLQLQATSHALKAQVFIQMNDLSAARNELNRAQNLFPAQQGNDHFIMIKWSLILSGLETKSLEPFDALKKIAIKNREWEACREADFYRLKVDYNRELFIHLYFGTPFAEFREHVARELGGAPTQDMYVFGPKASPRFDLRTGQIDGGPILNAGKKTHRLLEVLLRDLYQPLNVAGIFSALFPDECYDVANSGERVRQLIHRARAWIKESNIPVQILEEHGFYRIHIEGAFSFRIPLHRPSIESFAADLEQIQKLFAAQSFLAHDVQTRLQLPKSRVRLLLQRGIEKGLILRHGTTNRSACYVVARSIAKKAA